ncbi:MAG: hypothetical protein FWF72_00915 [Paludibacter sp.]|nr:hypothetical protein [Paludibacter sp.]
MKDQGFKEGLVAITQMIDDKHVFAVTYSENGLAFYRLDNQQWKKNRKQET